MRSAARRLGISIEQVREQEEPTHDLRVSELQAWQRIHPVAVLGGYMATYCKALRMDVIAWSTNLTAERAAERVKADQGA